MKKLLLAVVVAALAFALVPAALAGKPAGKPATKHGHVKFELVGKATAVTVADTVADPAAVSTLTIKVKAGSHIKGLKGKETVFNLAADAKVWLLTDDGRVAKTLADVAAGDRVKVKGTIAKADEGKTLVYTATNLRFKDLTPVEVTPPVQS
jgi:hypothetical protein